MNSKVAGIVVVILILVGGYFLFVKNSAAPVVNNTDSQTSADAMAQEGSQAEDGSMMASTTLPTTPAQAPAPTPVSTGTVKEFTVSAGNFYFSPKTLSVNKGDTVKITVTNAGGIHDLKIDEFNVSTQRLSSGQSETVTFVADKTGSFQYYCSVGTHRQMGMWGTLTVS